MDEAAEPVDGAEIEEPSADLGLAEEHRPHRLAAERPPRNARVLVDGREPVRGAAPDPAPDDANRPVGGGQLRSLPLEAAGARDQAPDGDGGEQGRRGGDPERDERHAPTAAP